MDTTRSAREDEPRSRHHFLLPIPKSEFEYIRPQYLCGKDLAEAAQPLASTVDVATSKPCLAHHGMSQFATWAIRHPNAPQPLASTVNIYRNVKNPI